MSAPPASPSWSAEDISAALPYLTAAERTELDGLLAADAVPDFGRWLEVVTPTWSWGWRHLAYARQFLARVTSGDLKRLMIFMPPRHGKSEQTTVRYPVFRLERSPSLRVCVGAYSQTFAAKFGRKSRRIARGRLALSIERSAAAEWETTAGGVYRSTGVGNPPTGEGFDLVVIDDSIKSREEAESEAYRDRVWDWYTDDLYTRLEPGGAIVLMQTRWHMDDLPGRILGSDDAGSWTVVSLPADAEEGDPLGREVGAPLCPERFDAAALADRRRVLGASYYALYQQRPVPREGGMIQRAWLSHTVTALPPDITAHVRYWDKAGTAGGGAYTAGVLLAVDRDSLVYVVDVVRGQWAATERERVIKATAEADRTLYGTVHVYVEQEPGSGGKESAESTIRNLIGHAVYADRPTGDKAVRLEPFAAQAGAGNVRVVIGVWNREYVDELATFPAGRYRDQADATSGAFNKLAPLAGGGAVVVSDDDVLAEMPRGTF